VGATKGARIEGGSIESGPAALAGLFVAGSALRPNAGLVIRDLHLDGRSSRGAGIQLEPTSVGTTLYDSVCVSGYPSSLEDHSADRVRRFPDPELACAP
jgi:hypothetical protein